MQVGRVEAGAGPSYVVVRAARRAASAPRPRPPHRAGARARAPARLPAHRAQPSRKANRSGADPAHEQLRVPGGRGDGLPGREIDHGRAACARSRRAPLRRPEPDPRAQGLRPGSGPAGCRWRWRLDLDRADLGGGRLDGVLRRRAPGSPTRTGSRRSDPSSRRRTAPVVGHLEQLDVTAVVPR